MIEICFIIMIVSYNHSRAILKSKVERASATPYYLGTPVIVFISNSPKSTLTIYM